ncbi:hypothetical protein GCM10014715_74680 [Streptomyces spiralis]|uniref:Uncharacterized protein n=1 Tax=Streptomyces spiralis TaxID=66376 RepID=A0A919E0Y0_9ACTN|nr:hypothetical protein [Streptomyces spiralis]GHF07865.1 hypothetical protein GCM10014715_74680 [Streptomyces spiralis]
MPDQAHSDEVIYDHLPDGTILGPIPFHDAEKMVALLKKRMAPENFQILTDELRAWCAAQHA